MRVKKFIQSSFILFLGSFTTKFLGYIYIIPLRKIEPKIESMMAFLLVPYAFLILFSVLGLRGSVNYKVAEETGNKKNIKSILFTGVIIVLVVSFIFAMMQFIFAKVMLRFNSVTASYEYYNILLRGTQLLSIALMFAPVSFVLMGFFAGMGNYKLISITNIIQQVCFILLIFLGTHIVLSYFNNNGYLIYVLSLSTILSVIIGFLILISNLFFKKDYSSILKEKLEIKSENMKFLFMLSVTFFITSIYITSLNRIDLTFLGWGLKNFGLTRELIEVYIGRYFTSSGKLIVVAVALSDAFSMVLIRHIKVLEKKEKPIQFNTILNLTIVLGLSLSLFYFVDAKVIYSFLYSYDKYGIEVLTIQSWLVFTHILRNILITYAITMGNKKLAVTSVLIVLVAKIPLSIILISFMGITGAVLSTIVPAWVAIFYIFYKMKNGLIINTQTVLEKVLLIFITIVPFIVIFIFLKYSEIKNNLISLVISFLIYLLIISPLIYYFRKLGVLQKKQV